MGSSLASNLAFMAFMETVWDWEMVFKEATPMVSLRYLLEGKVSGNGKRHWGRMSDIVVGRSGAGAAGLGRPLLCRVFGLGG